MIDRGTVKAIDREVLRQEVKISQGRARYEVAGEGYPVVLVHGLAGSTRWWYRNIPALAAHYRVYLVDLPGFGAMRRAPRPLVLARADRWLREWMEAVKIERAHLVGHSMGGLVSIRLAANFPQMVDRLVLVSPAGIPTGRRLTGNLLPLMHGALYTNPDFLAVLLRDSLRAGPWNLWRFSREILAEDVRHDISAIQSPTLLIWGKEDQLVPSRFSRLLRKRIPNSRLLMMEHVAHVPMFLRSDEFNRAVLAFLRGEEVGV